MNSNTAIRASAWVLNRRLSRSSHSSGEEALAHGVVVGVSDRAHRGAHTRLPAAMAELNGRVLGTLVGVVDHALRPPHRPIWVFDTHRGFFARLPLPAHCSGRT